MTNDDPLAAALLRLAHPFQVPTLQGEDDGETYVTVVTHAPLLRQLRDAIPGGIGAHESATSDPAARLPFDTGALDLYRNIERIVGVWYTSALLRPVGLSLEATLAEWYRSYRAMYEQGEVDAERYARRAARIESWCEQIEALFDPPTLVPLTAACPVCRRDRIVNHEGAHVHALVVEYWKVAERITRTSARCRGADCATVWKGWGGVEALIALVDARPEEAVDAWEHIDQHDFKP